MRSNLFFLARAAALFVAGAILPSCSTVQSLIPAPTPPPPERAATAAEKINILPLSAEDLDCPTVDVPENSAAIRVGGPANTAVRYQFDIATTARQCEPMGDKFGLKVGVSGHLLIGPAGAGGAYSAQLRVSVRNDITHQTAFTKTYRIEANTGAAAEAPWQLVTEPILLPFTRKELADDYSLSVGFDNASGGTLLRGKAK